MPSLAASYALTLEVLLLVVGFVLLWRLGVSPDARARPLVLPAWDVSLSDFFLFVWLTIVAGFIGQYSVGYYSKSHPLDQTHLAIIGTAALHGGMLAGMAIYRFTFGRRQPGPIFAFLSALRTGLATFLVTLPVITGVSLLWQVLLKALGYSPTPQISIELLRQTDSPALRAGLVAAAILIAPISEELLFRAGFFRYMRGRVPRWMALLLPALLFAALHLDVGSFVPLVALAIVFSLAYERTGNIGTTIVAHALFNLNATLLVLAGVDT